MKQSQKEIVKQELLTKGYITRNFCLNRYISRLSALILMLKREGMNIEGEDLPTNTGLDYKYTLIKKTTLF